MPDAVIPDAVMPDAVMPDAVMPDAVMPACRLAQLTETPSHSASMRHLASVAPHHLQPHCMPYWYNERTNRKPHGKARRLSTHLPFLYPQRPAAAELSPDSSYYPANLSTQQVLLESSGKKTESAAKLGW
jgi:hypothetical protein